MPCHDKLSFDPKTYQKETYQAWSDFIETGKLDRKAVPPMIAESWIRSRKNNVDPWDIPESAYLSKEKHQETIERHRQLISIAKPFMEEIYKSLEESKYIVALYCPEGYHLVRIGTFADFERARQFKIRVGLHFDEKTLGTSGFALVKRHEEAIQIVGCEHYHSLLHYIVGSYAPIKNPRTHELMGVIGIAGAKTMPNDHTLGTVLAAAKAIEGYFKLHEVNKILSVYGKALQTTIDTMSDGILIIDSAGMIYELNSTAKKIFTLNGIEVKGKHISEAMELSTLENSVMKILQAQDKKGEELELAVGGRKYLTTIKFVQDEKGKMGGVVVFLKDFKHLTKIAKDLSETVIQYTLSDMVGKSEYIEGIKDFVNLVAPSDAHLIIEGESGTGKEVLAHAIYSASPRMKEPFIVVNCSAIPSELFESIFFGHEKGAFTNAYRTHIGKFELADKGTIFLDEIAEMPLDMQVKLLRVLEEKKIERVGSQGRIEVDVRVIAATNKEITQEIKKGRFRRDLFYRLNIFRIKLPPLRERKEDIPYLIDYFAKQLSFTLNKAVKSISPGFYQRLMEYDWPGNIRELKNAVHQAMTIMDTEILDGSHLNSFFQQVDKTEDLVSNTYNRRLFEVEKEAIKRTLHFTRGNKRETAKILGIGRATLHRKLKAYDLKLI